ncbi:MAG: dodecin [Marinobacter sp.]|uniref:dodecin n=1 Tax=Marinobacter sp. TaxID=50741 RepID=UPI00299D3C98|nr:dodecin [Marinobacter sp.]MDX1756063.1 dodecin [Marinobacter sp.]
MSNHHTYKKVEVVGSSKSGIEEAINNALEECSKSIRNIEWYEVQEIRGHVVDGKVGHHQVVMKVGFRIEGS